MIVVPADRRDLALDLAFAGEVSVREERAAIARRTDSEPPHATCPWCPGWIPDPVFAGMSHGMCDPCHARENATLDALEASAPIGRKVA